MTSTTALDSSRTSTVVTGRATRVAIAGCGFIAGVHLQVLGGLADVEVVAVCDPQRARAERLAKKFAVRSVFTSVQEMLAAGGIDAVHVLVPPASHAEVASACLAAGLHVLVEKPLVLRCEQVETLATLAREHGRVLAVNHNHAFDPAVRKLQLHLGAARLGNLEHVALQHHVPLRQLQTGDVGRFMFESPANILFEQGVHLFSVVFLLLGPSQRVRALTSQPRSLQHGVSFVDDWQLSIDCGRASASVRLAFGRPLLETTLQAIGSDGAAFLDLQRGSCWVRRKTRWPDFLDHACNLARGSLHLARRALASPFGYALGLFGLAFPDDPFLRGMRGSLRAFHRAVRGRETLPPVMSAAGAAAVLAMCEQSALAAGVLIEAPPSRPLLPPAGPARPGEVVVLGGNGFVGRRCVRLLRAMGRPVTLLVRRPALLVHELRDGSVRIFAGDAADPAALAAAFAGATAVLHLATAAGDDDGAVETFMAAAVRAAAEAALSAKVKRFVYASSTAALWLGGARTIDGKAPTDPRPSARSPYARAKIAAERELAQVARGGLEVTIVRPAIVVGNDGVFAHSGIGLWVRDNHCVGWGRGAVPLPFVLVDDCAAGLVAALDAKAAGGRHYNLAGDVRLSARAYVAEMARRTGRAYRFHATALWWMWLQEVGKYLVKTLAGRPRQWPSLRDLRSRSFRTVIDCSDSKRDLGFHPVADREQFLERVFGPAVAHADGSR
ncbi:MAG TPA: Gfo/Idh/MocA family oxidoreductase [Planctomycetota bacterium]|nr:Gfo/Idh/MocA family oxidoreductase [Planctomycetota bacterium]